MEEKNLRDEVAGNELFAGLSDSQIEFMWSQANVREFKAGELLFRQDAHADRFYLVHSGAVVVEVPSIYGPTLELQHLGKGQILGWSWLITPYRWDFQATALRDSVVVEFDGEAILAQCEQDPELGYSLLKRFTVLMSERLAAARRKMMDQWTPAGFA
jgi:CRP-like cAMP-binding protein